MSAPDPQSAAPDWQADLRDLLLALPSWDLVSWRRGFVKDALGDHIALSDLDWNGDGATLAGALGRNLAFYAETLIADRHPGCALLAEVRRRGFHANPRVRSLVERIGQALAGEAPSPPAFCPYPGLLAYDWGRDRERARLFFGREAETQALVERLAGLKPGNLLVVSGASGSGKSSLVKAGLWRALHGPQPGQPESISGGTDWAVSAMTPAFYGDAFLSLVQAANDCARGLVLQPAAEASRLRSDPARFAGLLGRLLDGRPAWLLILDQLEEVFAREAEPYRDAFLALLLSAVQDPRLRLVATIRSDFLHHLNDHPALCATLNREPPLFVAPPGAAALADMIEGPARAVGIAVEQALTGRLVGEALGQSGGLALLGAVLQDLCAAGAAGTKLTLDHYEQQLHGLKGVLEERARRGFAALARDHGIDAAVAEALMRRVFAELVAIDPQSGAPTRHRAPREHWRGDTQALAFVEVFSRTPREREDNVRLLVCGEQDGQPTVEVAHEALLREWDLLATWIEARREGLLRKAEVLRDARRWDQAGRPDDFLAPGVRRYIRQGLEDHGFLEGVRRDEAVAQFLVEDDPAELIDLTERAFARRATEPLGPALGLLRCLTAPGRSWETTQALGAWVAGQDPALAAWLKAGLAEVLRLLGQDDALPWHHRRPGIGDLMAALGDDRPGVGLRGDGLPDICWADVPPPGPYRIARYPITNAQYLSFTQAEDYGNPDWWREGYLGPEPERPNWDQPNRPRIQVAWVEALAFCRWLTARYLAAGLIGAGEVVRLPTEAEWEQAATGGDGREYPWGAGYRVGYANLDETYGRAGPHNLAQTTAVGLYPQGASPLGLLDVAGNTWDWCLDKYEQPGDTDTAGDAGRSLRGGSWLNGPAFARAAVRSRYVPAGRDSTVGFRVVCSAPIPLNTETLTTDH